MLGNLSKTIIKVPVLATSYSTKYELFPITESSEISKEQNKREKLKPLNIRYFREKDYYIYDPLSKLNLGNNRRFINHKVYTSISPTFSQFINDHKRNSSVVLDKLKSSNNQFGTRYTNITSNSLNSFEKLNKETNNKFRGTLKSEVNEINNLLYKINEQNSVLSTDKFYNTDKRIATKLSGLTSQRQLTENKNDNFIKKIPKLKFPRLMQKYKNPEQEWQDFSDKKLSDLHLISYENKERLKRLYRFNLGKHTFEKYLSNFKINGAEGVNKENANVSGQPFLETIKDKEIMLNLNFNQGKEEDKTVIEF